MSQVTMELVPFNEAPWAPTVCGQQFDWAWRVTSPNGNVTRSSVSGTREKAEKAAKAAAARIKEFCEAKKTYSLPGAMKRTGNRLKKRD